MLNGVILVAIAFFAYSLAFSISSFFAFKAEPCVSSKFEIPLKNFQLRRKELEALNERENLFKFVISQELKEEKEEKKKKEKNLQPLNLDSFLLRGTVVVEKGKGFAFLEKKGEKKLRVLKNGESIEEFVLVKVFPDHVILAKGNQSFILRLFEGDERKRRGGNSTRYSEPSSNLSHRILRVRRKEVLREFSSGKFLKQIGITPSENPKGIKVLFVKRGSFIQKLGIRRGDIIISINDIQIRTLEDSFAAFERLKSSDSITITLLRNGKKLKLQYEIE